MLTDEEYTAIQSQLVAFAGIVSDMRLEEFIQRISRTETIAPLIDPTLYMQAHENLADIKELASSLLPFQKAINKIKERREPSGACLDKECG